MYHSDALNRRVKFASIPPAVTKETINQMIAAGLQSGNVFHTYAVTSAKTNRKKAQYVPQSSAWKWFNANKRSATVIGNKQRRWAWECHQITWENCDKIARCGATSSIRVVRCSWNRNCSKNPEPTLRPIRDFVFREKVPILKSSSFFVIVTL